MNCPSCGKTLKDMSCGHESVLLCCDNLTCQNIGYGTGQTLEEAEKNFISEVMEEAKG